MPAVSLLPFTSTAGSRKSVSPSAFRLTEKFILLLAFSAFITLCFGAIFFLPDSSKLLSGVFFHSARKSLVGGVGGDLLANGDRGLGGAAAAAAEGTQGDGDKLARIRKDHEKALQEAKDTLQKPPEEIKRDIRDDKAQLRQDNLKKEEGELPPVVFQKPVGAIGREPGDQDTRQKRVKIKE
uniref:Uncharacterized protein n=3 Tax=Latimeria chalumnae TaxID=7897 RepID=H3ADR0_LATCH